MECQILFSEKNKEKKVFPRKQVLIFHAVETICMQCQKLFSEKTKKKTHQFIACWISLKTSKD